MAHNSDNKSSFNQEYDTPRFQTDEWHDGYEVTAKDEKENNVTFNSAVVTLLICFKNQN